jgi:anti-sigma factor RsiW
MSTHKQVPPDADEDELHALVDGRLSSEEAAVLEKRLAADAEAAAAVASWSAQRETLRRLHRDVMDEPVPASLLAAATQPASVRRRSSLIWRWGGVAASVALAFAAGWAAHAQWPGATSSLASAAQVRSFARQAAVAHAVYSPEVRHPVEVTADQQEHLVQWLSKRLGKRLKVPTLAAHGFELMGGRLLPGGDGARAQFMFQNAAGDRVTLYMGALQKPGAAATMETAFSFSSEGPVPGFYWVDQGYGYALAGKLPWQALMDLATAVYRQL